MIILTNDYMPVVQPNYFNPVMPSQIEVRECLLLFDAESFIFQFAIQKVKDQDI